MVRDFSFATIHLVMTTWERIRQIPNYREVLGSLVFQRLFKRAPETKRLYGFSLHDDPSSPAMNQSKRFLTHAAYLVRMLDSALDMLGPDVEMLTDIMRELGERHSRYGVEPHMFRVMEECLLESIEQVFLTECNSTLTDDDVDAWKQIYSALSEDMIQAQRRRTAKERRETRAFL